MGRPPRLDWPGAWHHVMNRGIAKRTTFEGQIDRDCFLQLLSDISQQGWIEVHVYAIMFNHFHLLVRTQRGTISEGMQRIASRYVRLFNRLRDRDGALFRSRFTSRLVTSEAYWYAVLKYIDRNPVAAGLATTPTEYEGGSAWWYARQSGPRWLHREVVEAAVKEDACRQEYDPSDYARFTTDGDPDWHTHLVERRLRHPPVAADPLDRLIDPAGGDVREWMRAAAAMADGVRPGGVLVGPEALLHATQTVARALSPRAADCLRVGLLSTTAGLTLVESSRRLGRSTFWALARLREHRRRFSEDASYGAAVASTLQRALVGCVGRRGSSGVVPLVQSPGATVAREITKVSDTVV